MNLAELIERKEEIASMRGQRRAGGEPAILAAIDALINSVEEQAKKIQELEKAVASGT